MLSAFHGKVYGRARVIYPRVKRNENWDSDGVNETEERDDLWEAGEEWILRLTISAWEEATHELLHIPFSATN